MKRTLYTSAITAALSFAGAAQAAYATFDGQDKNGAPAVQVTPANSKSAEGLFKKGLLSGVTTEDFEDFAVDALPPLNLDFGSVAGKASLTGGGSSAAVRGNDPGDTDGFGRYSVPPPEGGDGLRFFDVDAGAANAFEVKFEKKVAAFGFYGVDLGDFAGTVTIDLFDDTTFLKSLTVPTLGKVDGDGSIVYFGVIAGVAAEDFTRVRFRTAGPGGLEADAFAFDNMTIGTRDQLVCTDCPVPVPTPGTLPLAALALLGLGVGVARRRA